MARPVQANAEATKLRILGAARARIAESGVDGTSLRDVAKGANVTIATVLHYFGSKDGLHRACVDAMYEELSTLKDALVGGMRPDQPLPRVVEAAVREAWRFARAHRPAHRMLLRTVLDTGRQDEAHRERHMIPFLEEGAAALAAATAVPPREARLVLQSVIHLVVRYSLTADDELAHLTGARAGEDPAALIEDHLVDVALRQLGLSAGPAREADGNAPRRRTP